MKQPSNSAEVVLAPLLRVLGPKRAAVARAAVSEGLIAVAPLLDLWVEETRVAEAEAASAAKGAHANRQLADLVEVSLARAIERSEERWNMVLDAAAAISSGASADVMVSAFGLEGPVASGTAFDEMMRDPDGVLELRSAPGMESTDHSPDLSPYARRYGRAPTSAAGLRALATPAAAPDRLTNADGYGACLRGSAGDAVHLGDGTAVMVRKDRYVIEPLRPGVSWRELSVFRLATGRPPTLLPSARAALASCLAKHGQPSMSAARDLTSTVLLGATVTGSTTPNGVLARIARFARDATEAATHDAIAAPLLEIASLVFQVHGRLKPTTVHIPRSSVGRPIDVGRVRWCRLSDSPRLWIPIGADDRDVIGGIDRPWTRDIPAAAAHWQATPSSMRLDPDWYARIVVVPGDSKLWCVDPDGTWWSLDSAFDAVVQSRREHLAPWLQSLEQFGITMPKQIKRAQQRATAAGKSRPPLDTGAGKSRPRGARSEAPSSNGKLFTKDWVRELAGRYSYAGDDAARKAGDRAASAGRYSRGDFLTVVRWKSPRAVPLAEQNTARAVVRATTAAFHTDSEVERMIRLLELRGVGVPIASALLHFAFPDRYPILDYRALASLGEKSRRTQYTSAFWNDYVQRCRGLAEDLGVSLRDLDKALWQHSRESDA